MEKMKLIDSMEKCPVCGEKPVFGYLCTEDDGAIKFNVHCPDCGCKVAKIYTAKMTFSYTGNFDISTEALFAVDDWNENAKYVKEQIGEKNENNRTSMTFSADVYEYIKAMARFSGITMSDFVDGELKKSMEQSEAYKFVLKTRAKLK